MTSKPIKIAATVVTATPGAPSPVSEKPGTTPVADAAAVASQLRDLLANFRKITVLLADEQSLPEGARDEARKVGQALFHENQERIARLDVALDQLMAPTNPGRIDALDSLLSYIESDPALYDADRLAFRELLQSMLADVAKDSSLPAKAKAAYATYLELAPTASMAPAVRQKMEKL